MAYPSGEPVDTTDSIKKVQRKDPMSRLETLSLPNLPTVQIAVSAGKLVLSGTIAMASPGEALGPFFKSVHEAATADGLKELQVDVTGLTFVNSSAIRLFVDWATWLKREDASRRYLLRFATNFQITWQKTSFGVLRSLAKDVILLDGK